MGNSNSHGNYETQDVYEALECISGRRSKIIKSWLSASKISKHDQVFLNMNKYCKNSSGSQNFQIKKLIKITQNGKSDQSGYSMLLWHGTNKSNVGGILKSGFIKGNSGLYGGGIYFADRISKSAGYTDNYFFGGPKYFILCDVNLEKVYKAHYIHPSYQNPPFGYDSVKGMGRFIPTWSENIIYDGSIVPLGKTTENKRHPSYSFTYNEYIVYDPQKVTVKFLVEI